MADILFDFTNEELKESFEEESFEFEYNEYNRLRNEEKNYYKPKEMGEKVVVSFITKKGEEYDCIYHKRTIEDIERLMKNRENINLRCCYIKDFDIEEIIDYEKYYLHNLDAGYSFWDGNTSFFKAQFGEGEVSFRSSQFREGDVWT